MARLLEDHVPQYSSFIGGIKGLALLAVEPSSGHSLVRYPSGEIVGAKGAVGGTSGDVRLWLNPDGDVYVLQPTGSSVRYTNTRTGAQHTVPVGIPASFGGGEGGMDERQELTVIHNSNGSQVRILELATGRVGGGTLAGGANGCLISKSGRYLIASHQRWTSYRINRDDLSIELVGAIGRGTGHGLPLWLPDGRECFMTPTSNWPEPLPWSSSDKYQMAIPLGDDPPSDADLFDARLIKWPWELSQHWGGWGSVGVISTYGVAKRVYTISTGAPYSEFQLSLNTSMIADALDMDRRDVEAVRHKEDIAELADMAFASGRIGRLALMAAPMAQLSEPQQLTLVGELPNQGGGYWGEPHSTPLIDVDPDGRMVARRIIAGRYDGDYAVEMFEVPAIQPGLGEAQDPPEEVPMPDENTPTPWSKRQTTEPGVYELVSAPVSGDEVVIDSNVPTDAFLRPNDAGDGQELVLPAVQQAGAVVATGLSEGNADYIVAEANDGQDPAN